MSTCLWAKALAPGNTGHGPRPMCPGAKAVAHKNFDIWAHKYFDIWAHGPVPRVAEKKLTPQKVVYEVCVEIL